jgi:hypothetical protein
MLPALNYSPKKNVLPLNIAQGTALQQSLQKETGQSVLIDVRSGGGQIVQPEHGFQNRRGKFLRDRTEGGKAMFPLTAFVIPGQLDFTLAQRYD